jgi:hypothetical protein
MSIGIFFRVHFVEATDDPLVRRGSVPTRTPVRMQRRPGFGFGQNSGGDFLFKGQDNNKP